MGVWIARVQLNRDESIRWKKTANRQQSEWRAVGGLLCVTGERIGFQPNRFDARTGGEPWQARLNDVVGVAIHDKQLDVPLLGKAGKLRNRLRIATPSGVELFVVNNVASVAADLDALLRGGPQG